MQNLCECFAKVSQLPTGALVHRKERFCKSYHEATNVHSLSRGSSSVVKPGSSFSVSALYQARLPAMTAKWPLCKTALTSKCSMSVLHAMNFQPVLRSEPEPPSPTHSPAASLSTPLLFALCKCSVVFRE